MLSLPTSSDSLRFSMSVALLGVVALALGCAGRTAESGADGAGDAGGNTGGTGGSTGGSSSGGSNTGGNAQGGSGGAILLCEGCKPGATKRIAGVRHGCANDGCWVPQNECMMGTAVDGCCGGATAVRSSEVVSSACLVPFPYGEDGQSDACILHSCPPIACGALDTPVTRVAGLGNDQLCHPVNECETDADCSLAINYLQCCAQADAYPKRMMAQEPCIAPLGAPMPQGQGCEQPRCAMVDCAVGGGDPSNRAHCVANAAGVKACTLIEGCGRQNVTEMFPDPAPPPGAGIGMASGYFWDGAVCRQLSGLCQGTDCVNLFATSDACLARYGQCGAVCVVGQDQTCNALASMSSLAGSCQSDGTCACLPRREMEPTTRRCL